MNDILRRGLAVTLCLSILVPQAASASAVSGARVARAPVAAGAAVMAPGLATLAAPSLAPLAAPSLTAPALTPAPAIAPAPAAALPAAVEAPRTAAPLAGAIPALAADVSALAAGLDAPEKSDAQASEGGRAVFNRALGVSDAAVDGGLAVAAAPAGFAPAALGRSSARRLPPLRSWGALALPLPAAAPSVSMGDLFWPLMGLLGAMVAVSGATVLIGMKAMGWWSEFQDDVPSDMTPARYFPKHVAAKWRSWRDPVRRAMAAQEKRTQKTLDLVNRKIEAPSSRIMAAISASDVMVKYMTKQYQSARAQGSLLGETVGSVSTLKKYFHMMFKALPGSDRELDYAEWFADAKGVVDAGSKSRIISPHFPSLLYKSVNDLIKAKYKVSKVTAYDDDGMREHPGVAPVEVANNTTEELVVSGAFYLENAEGRKIVVTFDPRRHQVIVVSPRSQLSDADAFLQDLSAWIEANHIYRGQKLTYADGAFHFLKGIKEGLSWDDYIIDPATRKEIEFYTTKWLDKLGKLQALGGPSSKELKSGLFLYGGKGIGKTLLSHVLMSELAGRASFINVTANSINEVGDVTRLFAGSRELGRTATPVIIHFAEFDTLGAVARDSKENRFLGQILEEMEGIHPNNGMLVIGTSNLPPSKMDSALFRPGRFEFRLQMPNPGEDTRRQMIQLYFQGIPLADGLDAAQFASEAHTGGFIPADFKQLAQLAVRVAWIDSDDDTAKVKAEHVLRAIAMIKLTKGRTELEEQPKTGF